MKKILAILICFVMLFCITACSSQSVQETTSSSTSTSKPQIKYYEGTSIPTLDSVLDTKLLSDISEKGSYYYSGFTDADDVGASILVYAEYVKKPADTLIRSLPRTVAQLEFLLTREISS